MGRTVRLSYQYGRTREASIFGIPQPVARGTRIPHSEVQDRDTCHVPLYAPTHRSTRVYLLHSTESVQRTERMLKISEIKMSVDKLLALAKTVTTIQVKLPLNKDVYTQTMLMARHQRIGKLFDEDFWGMQ